MRISQTAALIFTLLFAASGSLLAFKAHDDASGEAAYKGLRELAFGLPGISMTLPVDSGDPCAGKGILPAVDEESLAAINPDYAAWLYIPGTQVNYPVVSAKDNQRYLKKTFEGGSNSCGSLFFDSAAEPFSSLNTVIHGHNMRSGNMFGQLKCYLSASFWENHGELYLFRKGEWSEYRLFSVYLAQNMDAAPYRYLFISLHDFSDYAKTCRSKSIYDMGVDMEGKEEILTLSTCHGSKEKLILQWVK